MLLGKRERRLRHTEEGVNRVAAGRVRIGTLGQEQLDELRPGRVGGRGPVERGQGREAVARIHLRSVVQQHLRGLQTVVPGRVGERRAQTRGPVRVGPALQ